MPKIRDLGINTIPLAMQPPAIGNGGGGGGGGKPGDGDYTSGTPCHLEGERLPDYTSGTPCHLEGEPRKGEHPPDYTSGAACTTKSGACVETAGFTPEAVAQVRRQIESRSLYV